MNIVKLDGGRIILIHADCFQAMRMIKPNSIDMVAGDIPYGTTACSWDEQLPLKAMWACLVPLVKFTTPIVMFAAQPFTSILTLSNLPMFRYSLVWQKSRVGKFAQAPYRFLEEHEDILIFSHGHCAHNSTHRMIYNPQNTIPCYKPQNDDSNTGKHRPNRVGRGAYIQTRTNYPRSVLKFASDFSKLHSTQKPQKLLEYLISTYTYDNATVLDPTFGSCTTGAACVKLNRRFIGIERDKEYFDIGIQRIEEELKLRDENTTTVPNHSS